VKVGTIFEDSALGLDKWLTTVWLVANCEPGGISSYELARVLGVTQRTAWFVLHRIRGAMPDRVEVDSERTLKIKVKAQPEAKFSDVKAGPSSEMVGGAANGRRNANKGPTKTTPALTKEKLEGNPPISHLKNLWSFLKRPFQRSLYTD
jgi:hypothetical protein